MARERLRKAVSDLALEKLILRGETYRPNASGVKGVLDTVRWTVSALNGRSP